MVFFPPIPASPSACLYIHIGTAAARESTEAGRRALRGRAGARRREGLRFLRAGFLMPARRRPRSIRRKNAAFFAPLSFAICSSLSPRQSMIPADSMS
jgi:hypothetical protein